MCEYVVVDVEDMGELPLLLLGCSLIPSRLHWTARLLYEYTVPSLQLHIEGKRLISVRKGFPFEKRTSMISYSSVSSTNEGIRQRSVGAVAAPPKHPNLIPVASKHHQPRAV